MLINDDITDSGMNGEIDSIITGIDFPAGKDVLLAAARAVTTQQSVIDKFETLPDQDYLSREAVQAALEQQNTGDDRAVQDY